MLVSRKSLTELVRLKAVQFGFLAHCIAALSLCFIPLFDILGFERAFVTGLIAGPIAASISTVAMRNQRASNTCNLIFTFWLCVQLNFLLLMPSVVCGLLVEWFVQPCNPQEGLLFMLLLPGSTAVLGCAVGVSTGRIFQRSRTRFLFLSLFFLSTLSLTLFRLYSEPQIFVYSMPFGYWPGSLYDEDVHITGALLVHRSITMLVGLGIVIATDGISPLRNSNSRMFNVRIQRLIVSVLLAIGVQYLHDQGEELGFELTRVSIDKVLSRQINNEHFELRVDPSISKEKLQSLIVEHELHYEELTRFFQESPKKPIRVYIYRDANQKRFLMGAHHTQIARPWANEIHIHGFNVPHRVIKHELAHLFAAKFATGIFKVPSSTLIFVNMAIVEGTAVAADWPTEKMTVHEWARAMRAQKRAADPRVILYPNGFWAISAPRAYTIAGSFIRFLIDEHGIDRFKKLYGSNDFALAYEKSLDVLVKDWENFIDQTPLSNRDLKLAEHRFTRSGIFKKVCAHQTAQLAEQGYQAIHARDFDRGIEILEQVQRNRPYSAYYLIFVANALAQDGQLQRARSFLNKALRLPHITTQSRTNVKLGLGDLEWHTQNSTAARNRYLAIDQRNLSLGQRRLLQAKLQATEKTEEIQSTLMLFLLKRFSGGEALVRLSELSQKYPEDGLTRYLFARQLENLGMCLRGQEETEASLALRLPSSDFYNEALQMRGRMAVCAGRYEAAQKHFQQLVDTSTRTVDQLRAEEWMRRAKIRAEHAFKSE